MNDNKIKAIVFDWGDTLMRDFAEYSGPMVYWPYVEIVPGVEAALLQIYIDYICCVASNAEASDSKLIGYALARVNINSYFKEYFTSKELGARKPDIKFFQGILDKLNMKPNVVVMVGNDYIKDIVPAKTIGMRTVLFSEEKVTELTPYADHIINSMSELYSAILKIG